MLTEIKNTLSSPRNMTVGLLAVLSSYLLIPNATAQENCLKKEVLMENLSSKFKETVVSVGATGGGFIEVYSSPEGETWTIVITNYEGLSCYLSSGVNWLSIPSKVKGKVS